jgi:hypothetical protein
VVRQEHIDIFLRPVLPTLGGQMSYVVAILNRKGTFTTRDEEPEPELHRFVIMLRDHSGFFRDMIRFTRKLAFSS